MSAYISFSSASRAFCLSFPALFPHTYVREARPSIPNSIRGAAYLFTTLISSMVLHFVYISGFINILRRCPPLARGRNKGEGVLSFTCELYIRSRGEEAINYHGFDCDMNFSRDTFYGLFFFGNHYPYTCARFVPFRLERHYYDTNRGNCLQIHERMEEGLMRAYVTHNTRLLENMLKRRKKDLPKDTYHLWMKKLRKRKGLRWFKERYIYEHCTVAKPRS